ncbi:unnamed protein product [Allacma fusca]|uniref:Cytochrome P450 n=1 Tax=Allacma fusca TaxID=39272 RepID=A0A8J2LIN8_9HEXA|nr:unnamed protein product [Allacma fusca]
MFTALVVLFLSVLIVSFILDNLKNSKRPPGPVRYPIIGNLPQILAADKYVYKAYFKLAKIYGGIMSLKVGSQEMVILSTLDVMKELLDKDEVGGRMWTGVLVDRANGKNLGIAFSQGRHQGILKVFAQKKLREFGFGKRESMESIMSIELQEMMEGLRKVAKTNGGKHRMERFFQLSLLNVVWTMLAGKRYSHDDPRLHKLLKLNSMWFQSGNFGGGIVIAYPFLRFLFPNLLGYNLQKEANAKIYEFLTEMIAEHRSREGYDTDPQSFNDIFLAQIKADADKEWTAFTDEQFKVVCYDMFQAGFETTSNTMAFAILFMVLNQEVQAKIQKELDAFYPAGSVASMNDRDKIPYTSAAVHEVFRLGNILPFSDPRNTMEDVNFRGYFIPKDTPVAFNSFSIMRSEELWGDPENFRPERFLGPDGKLNEKAKMMHIGFGVGKRSCLGETLAQTTVFMAFTTLVRNFKFEPVPNKPLPTTEPVMGIILSPQPYDLIVKARD